MGALFEARWWHVSRAWDKGQDRVVDRRYGGVFERVRSIGLGDAAYVAERYSWKGWARNE